MAEYPDCVAGLIFRAILSATAGQFDQASRDLRRADELAPGNPVVARFREFWGGRAPEYDF